VNIKQNILKNEAKAVSNNGASVLALTHDLCAFASGVVVPINEQLFERIAQELPIRLFRYSSGSTFNGWLVPQSWRVEKAEVRKNGRVVFDGNSHVLGVATYSKSFLGEMDLADLQKHLVTNPNLPHAFIYHSMWQYRPWDSDWALSVPYEIYQTFEPGRYEVELVTHYEPGEMLVAEFEKKGQSEDTIVFNAHTCHPQMANDDFAGAAVLIRLFQWLQGQDTYFTYRLVLGPEHLGTVFYLRDQSKKQLKQFVGGAFAEMPGTQGPIKLASSFLGNQQIDLALRHAAHHYSKNYVLVPWRQGAGNDETVWEAPGYEVPFVEVSRSENLMAPYREYHTSLDTADLMNEEQLDEFFNVFQYAVKILEQNAVVKRRFDGLICLSNPEYNLYFERPDPAVSKNLAEDSEKWGYLLDCLLRYFDGSMTILDIAEKHDLPFDRVYQYLSRFKEKDLVDFEFATIRRVPISKIK
jgi:aminopeptidase-like protein